MAHRFQSELYHAFFLDAPAEQLLVPFDFGVSDLDLFQSDTCAHLVQVFERCGLVALGLFVAGLGVVEIDFRQAEGRINRLHRSVILGFAQRLVGFEQTAPYIAYAGDTAAFTSIPLIGASIVVVAGELDILRLVGPPETVGYEAGVITGIAVDTTVVGLDAVAPVDTGLFVPFGEAGGLITRLRVDDGFRHVVLTLVACHGIASGRVHGIAVYQFQRRLDTAVSLVNDTRCAAACHAGHGACQQTSGAAKPRITARAAPPAPDGLLVPGLQPYALIRGHVTRELIGLFRILVEIVQTGLCQLDHIPGCLCGCLPFGLVLALREEEFPANVLHLAFVKVAPVV